ncbi:unnamed protein product, partial [marine sediment metagenome]
MRTFLLWGSLLAGIIVLLSNPKKAIGTKKKPALPVLEEIEKIEEGTYKKEKKAVIKVVAQKKIQKPSPKSDLESDIGKKWLPKIGIISIVLGVAFFVIYAIQN